jgi:hypothetical protein
VYYVVSNVKIMVAQVFSIVFMFLQKPLPAPNVAQVAANVVEGGMKLATTISTPPVNDRDDVRVNSPLRSRSPCSLPDMSTVVARGGEGKLAMRDRNAARRKAVDARKTQSYSDLSSNMHSSVRRGVSGLSMPVLERSNSSSESLPGLLEEAAALERGEDASHLPPETLRRMRELNAQTQEAAGAAGRRREEGCRTSAVPLPSSLRISEQMGGGDGGSGDFDECEYEEVEEDDDDDDKEEETSDVNVDLMHDLNLEKMEEQENEKSGGGQGRFSNVAS